jgi:hypothetical protein
MCEPFQEVIIDGKHRSRNQSTFNVQETYPLEHTQGLVDGAILDTDTEDSGPITMREPVDGVKMPAGEGD